jgi:hypothetical protein
MFETLNLPKTNPCTGNKTWQGYTCFHAAILNAETNEPNKGLVLHKSFEMRIFFYLFFGFGFGPIHTLPRHLYHKNAKP